MDNIRTAQTETEIETVLQELTAAIETRQWGIATGRAIRLAALCDQRETA